MSGPTDAELDEVARSVAVSLMRLCQRLDVEDAMEYRPPARWARLAEVRARYRRWFSKVAEPRSIGFGEVTARRGPAHRRVP